MKQQPNQPARSTGQRGARSRLLALALAMAVVFSGAAVASVETSVNGSTVTSSILLSDTDADLTLSFSEVENLADGVIGVDAELLGALDLPHLLDRLLGLDLSAVLDKFPVLVDIRPASQFEFANTVRVEVHTEDLVYAPGTRIRLFKSERGGPFFDITEAVEPGSVRARGRTGGFSEFMLLNDSRSTSSVIREKYSRIEARLEDAAPWLPAGDAESLEQLLSDSRGFFDQGDVASAIASLDLFDAEIRQRSGTVLPNRWSADRSTDNIGGDLQAAAATLRFSLGFLRDYGN